MCLWPQCMYPCVAWPWDVLSGCGTFLVCEGVFNGLGGCVYCLSGCVVVSVWWGCGIASVGVHMDSVGLNWCDMISVSVAWP